MRRRRARDVVRVHVPTDQAPVFIVPYAAVGAVERAPLGVLRRTPHVRARLEAGMQEVAALATARGVELPPDAVAAAMQRFEVPHEAATASMHRDIANGRPPSFTR